MNTLYLIGFMATAIAIGLILGKKARRIAKDEPKEEELKQAEEYKGKSAAEIISEIYKENENRQR